MPVLGLFAAAVMWFQMAWAGKAFTLGYTLPLISRGAAPRPTSVQAQPVSDGAALHHATVTTTSLSVGLRGMGCAAVLLLAARARFGAKSNPKLAKSCRARVVCAAAGLPCTSNPANVQEVAYLSKAERVLSSTHLISLDQVTPLVPAPASPCPAPRAAAFAIVPELASTSCPSSAPASTARQPRPASFVGGSRRSQRRARSSRSQSTTAARRAARRAVGAQLISEPRIAPEPLVLSFDPSCLRGEIQSGLQLPASMRSACSREARAPAVAKNCGLDSDIYVRAMHSNSLDKHQRRTTRRFL